MTCFDLKSCKKKRKKKKLKAKNICMGQPVYSFLQAVSGNIFGSIVSVLTHCKRALANYLSGGTGTGKCRNPWADHLCFVVYLSLPVKLEVSDILRASEYI